MSTYRRARVLRSHRLALVRLRGRWAMSLALAMAMASAVALTATVPLVESPAASAALRNTVRGLGPSGYVEIDQRAIMNVDDYARVRDATEQGVATALGRRLIADGELR